MHSDKPLSQEDKDLIRAHREELRDHVPADVQRIWDFIDGNCYGRPRVNRSHPLPHPVALEDVVAGTSRPALDRSHPLSYQVETEAAMKDVEERSARLLMELGRIEKDLGKKRS